MLCLVSPTCVSSVIHGGYHTFHPGSDWLRVYLDCTHNASTVAPSPVVLQQSLQDNNEVFIQVNTHQLLSFALVLTGVCVSACECQKLAQGVPAACLLSSNIQSNKTHKQSKLSPLNMHLFFFHLQAQTRCFMLINYCCRKRRPPKQTARLVWACKPPGPENQIVFIKTSTRTCLIRIYVLKFKRFQISNNFN